MENAMGLLVDGVWQDDSQDKNRIQGGRFVRPQARYRNFVTPDGSPGPTGEGGFAAEAGRYHLYVSPACPWAHRAIIFRRLKELEGVVSMSTVSWLMGEFGWNFDRSLGSGGDEVNGKSKMSEIYLLADPHYSGRVSVPVLWDKKRRTIVNNESSEIIRMFNSAFDGIGAAPGDYYPEALRGEIDALNERIYTNVNNGVYRSGFARSQGAYDEAVRALFSTLDWLEEHLAMHRWLCGERLTEADWRLFTTLIRFDPVYVGHFKCNIRRIADYRNLTRYLRELYAEPGIAETVNFQHIKGHYYQSHPQLNPSGIVPVGPELQLEDDPGTSVA
jgi:glutathionyl-hydroquinone reductase